MLKTISIVVQKSKMQRHENIHTQEEHHSSVDFLILCGKKCIDIFYNTDQQRCVIIFFYSTQRKSQTWKTINMFFFFKISLKLKLHAFELQTRGGKK